MSILADVASGVTVAAIPLLAATVGIELWQLLVLVFLGALFDAPGATARRSLLPDLVQLAGTRMERATGSPAGIQRGSILVGAPIAGLLVTVMGAPNVLWLNTASFAVSALLVARLVPVLAAAPATRPSPASYFSDLLIGLRFITRDPLIRMVVLIVLVTNFLDAPFPVVFPVFARRRSAAPSTSGDARRLRRRGAARLARVQRDRASAPAAPDLRVLVLARGAPVPRAFADALAPGHTAS